MSGTIYICRSTGSETDSWSDDSVGDKLSRSWDATISDDDSSHDGSDSVSAKQSGCLNFQYSEWSSPYERVPLSDKVYILSVRSVFNFIDTNFPMHTLLKNIKTYQCINFGVSSV